MFDRDLLKGKRILVTGGGSGLGKTVARRVAELGGDIVICGRREQVLAEAADEIAGATGARVQPIACDVRDAAAVETMMDRAWSDGPLDILMNNAAGNFIARSETLTPRAVDSVLNIALHGTFYCTLAAGRRWIEGGRPGTVLSTVSTPAFTGLAFTVPSAAAKAGVLAMTRSLAVEWGPKGIRLLAIAPGLFPTVGAWDRLYPVGSLPEPQELGVPLRRFGDHAEFANMVCFLISDGASYVNGECVVVDGGRWLQGIGGGMTRLLQDLSSEQWDAFRTGR